MKFGGGLKMCLIFVPRIPKFNIEVTLGTEDYDLELLNATNFGFLLVSRMERRRKF